MKKALMDDAVRLLGLMLTSGAKFFFIARLGKLPRCCKIVALGVCLNVER